MNDIPIVLGLGGCLDSEIELAEDRLQSLVDRHRLRLVDITQPATLDEERDVLRSVLAYMRSGEGGERHVRSIRALLDFTDHFDSRTTLGGTNVRAGEVLGRLGHRSILHVPGRNAEFERLLHPLSVVPESTPEAEYVPHLIVQYPPGLAVRLLDGEVRSPRPNRIILVNDPISEITPLHEELLQWLKPGGIVLLSGLNSVRDSKVLDERLTELSGVLEQSLEGLEIVYEDADYHVSELRSRVYEKLVPYASIVSMNEDELSRFVGASVDITDPLSIADSCRSVLAYIPHGTLIVHSQHWALAAGPDADRLAGALEAGIAAAGARYLHGDAIDDTAIQAVRDAHLSAFGRSVSAQLPDLMDVPVRCVPARRLETGTPTTIGLGDTFAGGLIAGLVRRRTQTNTLATRT